MPDTIEMNSTPTRRKRRTPEQMIADLEAKIVAVKQRSATSAGRPRMAKRRPAPRSASAADTSAVEDLLRAAAAELGLSRAIAILEEQRRTLQSIGVLGARPSAARELLPQPRPYVMTPARPPAQRVRGSAATAPVSLLSYERMAVERALAECAGDRRAAAKLLGVGKSTMYRRMQVLAVASPAQRGSITVAPDDPVLAAGVPVSLHAYEKAALVRALDECGGNKLDAARLLGVGKSTLYRMAGKHGIG